MSIPSLCLMLACQCHCSTEIKRKATRRIIRGLRQAQSDSSLNQTTSVNAPYTEHLLNSTTPYFADAIHSIVPYFADHVNTTVPYFAAVDNSTIPYYADKKTPTQSSISSTTTPRELTFVLWCLLAWCALV